VEKSEAQLETTTQKPRDSWGKIIFQLSCIAPIWIAILFAAIGATFDALGILFILAILILLLESTLLIPLKFAYVLMYWDTDRWKSFIIPLMAYIPLIINYDIALGVIAGWGMTFFSLTR
jgi:hypothetical protein